VKIELSEQNYIYRMQCKGGTKDKFSREVPTVSHVHFTVLATRSALSLSPLSLSPPDTNGLQGDINNFVVPEVTLSYS
jgi:hypothetical protein